jgi:hypothetical protein
VALNVAITVAHAGADVSAVVALIVSLCLAELGFGVTGGGYPEIDDAMIFPLYSSSDPNGSPPVLPLTVKDPLQASRKPPRLPARPKLTR